MPPISSSEGYLFRLLQNFPDGTGDFLEFSAIATSALGQPNPSVHMHTRFGPPQSESVRVDTLRTFSGYSPDFFRSVPPRLQTDSADSGQSENFQNFLGALPPSKLIICQCSPTMHLSFSFPPSSDDDAYDSEEGALL